MLPIEHKMTTALTADMKKPLISSAQRRMWSLLKMSESSAIYNIITITKCIGQFDLNTFIEALKIVVSRHEMLRSTFKEVSGELVREVLDSPLLDLETFESGANSIEKVEVEFRDFLRGEAAVDFDLEKLPLFKVRIGVYGEAMTFVGFIFSHLVMDGWSLSVFYRDVRKAYDFLLTGNAGFDLSTVSLDSLADEQFSEKELEECCELLKNCPEFELPSDHTRCSEFDFKGERQYLSIGFEVAERLETLAKASRVSLYMLLLTCFAAVISRFADAEEVVVGSPVANRLNPELEEAVGLFVNTLVFRIEMPRCRTVEDTVKSVRNVVLRALAKQHVPFERVVERLKPSRSLSRNPLFQVMFALQNVHDELQLPGLLCEDIEPSSGFSLFDLECVIWRKSEGLKIRLGYNTSLYSHDSIARIGNVFTRTLNSLSVKCPATSRLSELVTLDDTERSVLSGGKMTPRLDLSVIEIFEEVAKQHSDKTALIDSKGEHSFSELISYANRIAEALDSVAAPGARVGIFCGKSIGLAASILGTMKAGRTFIPLNVNEADARRTLILEDSAPDIVLVENSILSKGFALPVPILAVDSLPDSSNSSRMQRRLQDPASAAYILFTSGTSGRPKGVCVSHSNLAHTMRCVQEAFSFSAGDVMPCLANPAFDIFLFELFAMLLSGGTADFTQDDGLFEPQQLEGVLSRATCLHAVPALMRHIESAVAEGSINGGDKLRIIFTGGDAVNPQLLADLKRTFPDSRVIVLYGPTEATIVCAYYDYLRLGHPQGQPVGVPFADVTITVCDEGGNLVPRGTPGEIVVSGEGVSCGYLSDEPESSGKFFSLNGVKAYKTGDRGRITAENYLEFLGRNDTQIKVRGFRVEVSEVETVLTNHPEIANAAVALSPLPSGESILVAYVSAKRDLTSLSRDDEKLSLWKSLFNHTHESVMDEFHGWNSSVTGDRIDKKMMEDWANSSFEFITGWEVDFWGRETRPRVLEIGAGTGLLVTRLAPHTRNYVATDFSDVLISQLGEKVSVAGLDQVDCIYMPAHEIDELSGKFDVIILNSVVQYFPSGAYLQAVINKALDLLTTDGTLLIGDIRDLRTFAELQGIADVPQAISQCEELLVDPTFFSRLQFEDGRVGAVSVHPRLDSYDTELSRFRYNCVIHARGKAVRCSSLRWLDGTGLSFLAIGRILQENAGLIAIRGLKNSYRVREVGKNSSPVDVTPKALQYLAVTSGRAASVLLGNEPHFLDVVFTERGVPPLPIVDTGAGFSEYFGELFNVPNRASVEEMWARDIKFYLQSKLPDYMVPSSIEVLDEMPLTKNGKIDRKALPSPSFAKKEKQISTHLESRTIRLLCELWIEVLGHDHIDKDEDFFECGGTSLSVVRLVVRARREGLKIKPQDVFRYKTIEALSKFIDASQKTEVEIPVVELEDVSSSPSVGLQNIVVGECSSRNIFLTGATGFLGVHLLNELLRTSNGIITCLVRGYSESQCEDRLAETYDWYFDSVLPLGKIRIVRGDLGLPQLGLSTDDMRMASGSDRLYHAAADVRHVGCNEQFYRVNEGGTRELLKLLCSNRHTSFHHVSTIGVKGLRHGDSEAELQEDDLDIGQMFSEAYSRSKFRAELAVKEYSEAGGHCLVYRVGTIAPHGVTGKFQRNIDSHFFSRFLRSIILSGVAPYWNSRMLSLTPVDFMARAIVMLSEAECDGGTFHIDNPNKLSYSSLISALHYLGYSIRFVLPKEYERKIYSLDLGSHYDEVLSGLVQIIDSAMSEHTPMVSTKSIEKLRTLSLSYPEISLSWIKKFIECGQALNYFPTPQNFDKFITVPLITYNDR